MLTFQLGRQIHEHFETKIYKTNSILKTVFECDSITVKALSFGKHCGKRRNCTKRAISPFATMFSTFSHRLSIQLWRFLCFDKIRSKSSAAELSYEGKG